jgi:hypothetical protein
MERPKSHPYRVIYNHDGGTLVAPFFPFSNLPFSIDNFVAKTVGHLRGTQVDAVTWTLGTDNQRIAAQQGPGRASNMYCHETDVGERFYEIAPPFKSKFWQLHAERARSMIEAGDDPPKVVVEHGHRRGLDVLLGFRMNDLHDSRLIWRGNPTLMWMNRPLRYPVLADGKLLAENLVGYVCKMKLEHPELLIGEHQAIGRRFALAFDYAQPAVREFRLALIKEACEKYDLDGVELDFMRTFIVFKPGEEAANCGLMNDFIAQVRGVLDTVGSARGKRLQLVLRTLAPLQVSKEIGLDVHTWLEAGWVDGLILGIDDRSNLPLGEDAATAHHRGCPVYASIKVDAYQRKGATPEIFRAIAANHYRLGVDGVQLFNMNALRDDVGFNPAGYGLGPNYDFQPLREIGSSETLRFKNKHYVLDNLGTAQHANGIDGTVFEEWPDAEQDAFLRAEFGTTAARTEVPVRLTEDRPATFRVYLADDLADAQNAGRAVEVTLRLSFRDVTGSDHIISPELNGTALAALLLADDYPITYVRDIRIDGGMLALGTNSLRLALSRGVASVISELWVEDVELLVAYDP